MRSRLTVLLAACAGVVSSACGGPQYYMKGDGPAARSLAALGTFTLILFSAVTLVTWLLIGWAAVRRRGSLKEHAPVDVGGGHRWVVVGGFGIPFVVLATVFVLTLVTLGGFPKAHAAERAGSVPEIRVLGHQWWFEAVYLSTAADACSSNEAVTNTYFRTATEIHVPVGRSVDIELASRDVIHSFWVPRLHGKVDLIPGQANRVRIQADHPGVFEGECGEFCGMGHALMRILIVAERPADFERWRAAQTADARTPVDAEEKRGKAVFEAAACPLCHTVRGTSAHGLIGPDLTHFGSRSRIAGGSLTNDTANLAAWVTHAQSLKPGAQMPNLTQFSGEELLALVKYLQTLR
jgi:cytochrome c oxidase subunit 2